jgi:glutaredoxin
VGYSGTGGAGFPNGPSGDKMIIRLYKTPTCPRCHRLAGFMQLYEIEFTEEPLDAGAMTEYLCATGKPAMMAPILQVDESWYGPEQLFEGQQLAVHILQDILSIGR